MSETVSLIIPTLNAEGEIGALIEALLGQSRVPNEILVVDSSSDDGTVGIASSYREVSVEVIDRRDFDHGLTRDRALRRSSGDIACFMTQDAVPANDAFIENLVAPILSDPSVAVSSGRQLPKADARRFEQLVRAFNYTDESNVRSRDDVPRLGIKAYFATDVCAAYRRSAYLELGGFGSTDMSEDMLMAAKAVKAGWKVAYAADAEVYHSHNLTPRQQYERNFAIGRFLERNADLLSCASEVGEGGRLARDVATALVKEANIPELLAFAVDCAARFAGNRAGRKDVRKARR
ncbi:MULTISPECIES: glycosyltransferase family 2 protein [unclassified Collinsella]|uniref:glycosyltransferase n=1 Tax=unclassified Collinsella TaxID=2637548 RepID=UPI000E4BC7B1|nr:MULTISPECIES: glycosyltransferase family 2 protein [unclassified Collinsella]RHJ39276.1 glycosyltransferase family 2 protein [Collinsella sp. AM10-48]RHJ39587.1 glycosyltransferase family 2 protein [Collinsella sp. AM10-32]RHJ42908.1 glycosyltransferase family 2 protein [Collinsella sp. AM10-27]RHJ44963.1 glycosyltransferase family 2 protein [Collinsella sp. AM10-26]RHJ52428.1 glycosyltransferase family 2 protein [Collinsella sp. AM10-11]